MFVCFIFAMVASSPWLNHSLQCSKTAFFLTHSSKTAVRIYARFYSNGFYRGRSSPDPFFPPNTRAVDFQLTEAQAKEAFFEWHGSNIFAPSELHGGAFQVVCLSCRHFPTLIAVFLYSSFFLLVFCCPTPVCIYRFCNQTRL